MDVVDDDGREDFSLARSEEKVGVEEKERERGRPSMAVIVVVYYLCCVVSKCCPLSRLFMRLIDTRSF